MKDIFLVLVYYISLYNLKYKIYLYFDRERKF